MSIQLWKLHFYEELNGQFSREFQAKVFLNEKYINLIIIQENMYEEMAIEHI